MEENKLLGDLLVKGELTSVSYRSQSGHYYFTIGEDGCLLHCVMFSRYAQNLSRFPEEGSVVIVRGTVTLYEREGQYQLMAYDIQSLGQGSGTQDIAALRERLRAEGLLSPERKRPLLRLPRAVGLITSGEGAAVQDIITGLNKHNNCIPIVLYSATVQGNLALSSILAALKAAIQENRCEVLILGRGGGASETFAVFNEEELLRAVAASPIPVISAVGHDVDFTLLDEVADARAATPTAACQLCCIAKDRLLSQLEEYNLRMQDYADASYQHLKTQLEQNLRLLRANSPQNSLNKNGQQLNYLVKLMQENMDHRLWKQQHECINIEEQLNLLNPAAPLERGYSITTRTDGTPIASCHEVVPGDTIITRLRDGKVISVAQKIVPKEEGSA